MSIKYEIEKEKLEEIRKARSKTNNKKEDRRLYVIELRILGYTNEEIVEKTDVNPRTIVRWIKSYIENGVQGILNKKRQGNHWNLTYEEEEKLLEKFINQADSGQMTDVKQLKEEYVKMVGHSIGGSQIYRLLKRHGYRKVMPRSRHPKKASEEVIETSKKLTQWQRD
ncbi:winged helix-turn helix [Peptostreptococcaceae bacterium AS15]|nr:winged helix-turn helix [Peptostreptococcaceae bacterium AS15]EJP26068.1 winged helix-turn helix [Peptostreptococcaceae bacterium AS15]